MTPQGRVSRRPRPARRWQRWGLVAAIGCALGVVVLHPVTMAIYWLEFRAYLADDWSSASQFIASRMGASFTAEMVPMTALFAGLGGLIASVHAAVSSRLRRSERVISHLEQEITRDVHTLISRGETEHVEFKASARWDARLGKTNKALSDVVIKTIAALANHEGGSLLVGVSDDGSIVGLSQDYGTLKRPDRDGFAQFLMSLVRQRLGGHVCRLVHVLFTELDNQDVCRVVVEPADSPVYVDDGRRARFFVRAGNSSRELDAREIVNYVAARWAAEL